MRTGYFNPPISLEIQKNRATVCSSVSATKTTAEVFMTDEESYQGEHLLEHGGDLLAAAEEGGALGRVPLGGVVPEGGRRGDREGHLGHGGEADEGATGGDPRGVEVEGSRPTGRQRVRDSAGRKKREGENRHGRRHRAREG